MIFWRCNCPRAALTAFLRTPRCSTYPARNYRGFLLELFKTLKRGGVLFSSNPRGNNEEGLSDDRYACFFDLDTWRD